MRQKPIAMDEGKKTFDQNMLRIEDASFTARRALLKSRRNNMLFAATLVFYVTLAIFAYFISYFDWDKKIADAIQSITLPGFHSSMIFLSMLGDRWIPFAIVIVVSLVLLVARKRIEGIVCLCGIALGAMLNEVTKLIIARPRPDQSLVQVLAQYQHNSFPSGHTFFFVEFFGFLFFVFYVLPIRGAIRYTLFVILGALIALIGVSRIYMGAHWPSDVIGGYLAGTLWLTLMIKVYQRLKQKQAFDDNAAG